MNEELNIIQIKEAIINNILPAAKKAKTKAKARIRKAKERNEKEGGVVSMSLRIRGMNSPPSWIPKITITQPSLSIEEKINELIVNFLPNHSINFIENFKDEILKEFQNAMQDGIPPRLTSPKQEEYFSRSEAAHILKVSSQTLSNWQKKGILIGTIIGTSTHYKKSQLLEFVAFE